MPRPIRFKKKSQSWTDHKKSWHTCRECDLCETRHNTVLCRGQLPCDLLFVGEAPGLSEDVLGKPFIGPVGVLLGQMIEAAEESIASPVKLRKAFTNLVACVPTQEEHVGRYREPTIEEIRACSSRLNDLVQIAKPRAIVMLGKKTQKYAPLMIDYDFEFSLDLIHPSTILHADLSQRGLAIQRSIVCLRDLFISMV